MNKEPRKRSGFYLPIAALILVLMVMGIMTLIRRPMPVQDKEQFLEEIYLPSAPLYSSDEERIPVQLFFPDKKLQMKRENREIYNSKELVNRLRQVLVLLLDGPRSEHLLSIYSVGVRLRELYLHEGCAYVDLQVQPLKVTTMGCRMEYLSIMAIQESLMKNFPEVEKIKIVVNGQEEDTLFGHINIRKYYSSLYVGDPIESAHRDF